MLIAALYAAVILIATTLGAFVGLGGGVIIKPVLDFIGKDPRTVVDFLSCAAVLTMSIVSTGKAIKRKQKFETDIIVFLAVGSIAGGYLGNYLVDLISKSFNQDNMVRGVQAVILAVLLLFVAIYMSREFKSFKVKNKIAILLVGLCLGTFASFLGIGGGPINVAVIALFFSINARDGAVYSVAIIFFSQITKLITLFAKNGISTYTPQWKTLCFILPAAVLGGIIGSKFNRKFNEKTIRAVFSVCMLLLVGLNIYNALHYFM